MQLLKIEERKVTSSCSRINKLLGSDYKIEDMKNILDSLLIKTEIDGDNLISSIPTFRNDIALECDIAEEVPIFEPPKEEKPWLSEWKEKSRVAQNGCFFQN